MARPEYTEVAPGVRRHDFAWGYCLEGSEQALLEAKLVERSWLPELDQRDSAGRRIMSNYLEHEGRRIRVQRAYPKGREHRMSVWIDYSADERRQREEREDYAEALAAADREIAGLPSSHEEYRDKTAHFVRAALGHTLGHLAVEGHAGYRYAPEALEDIKQAVGDLLVALNSGRTLFDPKARAAAIAEIRANTAGADPGLQAFLKRLQA